MPESPLTLRRRDLILPEGQPLGAPPRDWHLLPEIVPDSRRMAVDALSPGGSSAPAVAGFDILRTRLLQALAENGWRRIAITSPTHGAGKTFVATNLALSLARRQDSRTVLLDLELRNPRLAAMFGVTDAPPIEEFLADGEPRFVRLGPTLALGLNGTAVERPAELLQSPAAARALTRMMTRLSPEVLICDMPPALGSDDVIALLPQLDAVLLVSDGRRNTAAELRACERLLEGRVPLLGVVLNHAKDRDRGRYLYGRR